MKKKVIIGLSGGIDSAVAAYLLKKDGYDVVGLYIDINLRAGKKDRKAVENIAKQLDIELIVKRSYQAFKKNIIDEYVNCYLNALTPNPCIRCNKLIKFKELFNQQKKIRADYVATGHYARISYEENNKGYVLKKGKDKSKDQSYFLYTLKSEELSKILFPLGEYTKKQIKLIANKCGLNKYSKKESQEVCFIPDKDQVKFFKKNYNIKSAKGDIVDIHKNKIGQHKGFMFYTIGQRKGLGIAHSEPLYVIKIDSKNNCIVAAPQKWLYNKKINIDRIVFTNNKIAKKPFKAKVKIRYRHLEAEAMVKPASKGNWQVIFTKAQKAVTPGQSVVFYKRDRVIGGGIIKGVSND
jgi:tRNA-specific 2-thiouridylase